MSAGPIVSESWWIQQTTAEANNVEDASSAWTVMANNLITVTNPKFAVGFEMFARVSAAQSLQVWRNSLTDPKTALAKYKSTLRLGNSRSVPELFGAMGARFSFDVGIIRELMEFLRGELQRVT
jgi:hypothetical protein